MLEAGACAVVCPEARHAGGWGLCVGAQKPDMLEAGTCLPDMLASPEARRAGGWGLRRCSPRGQTCWRLGLVLSFAQRPDMLEAGACAVVCPEARHAGGWGQPVCKPASLLVSN